MPQFVCEIRNREKICCGFFFFSSQNFASIPYEKKFGHSVFLYKLPNSAFLIKISFQPNNFTLAPFSCTDSSGLSNNFSRFINFKLIPSLFQMFSPCPETPLQANTHLAAAARDAAITVLLLPWLKAAIG